MEILKNKEEEVLSLKKYVDEKDKLILDLRDKLENKRIKFKELNEDIESVISVFTNSY